MNVKLNHGQEEKTVSKIWNFTVAVLFTLSFVVFYVVPASGLVRWLLFLLVLASSLGVFFFLSPLGLSLRGYFKDTWYELNKVVWPARKEALQFTWIVFLFVLLIGVFLWLADSFFSWILYDFVFKR